jgi:hypothetical protein
LLDQTVAPNRKCLYQLLKNAIKCFDLGNKLMLQESNATLVSAIQNMVCGNCGLFSPAKTVADLQFTEPENNIFSNQCAMLPQASC